MRVMKVIEDLEFRNLIQHTALRTPIESRRVCMRSSPFPLYCLNKNREKEALFDYQVNIWDLTSGQRNPRYYAAPQVFGNSDMPHYQTAVKKHNCTDKQALIEISAASPKGQRTINVGIADLRAKCGGSQSLIYLTFQPFKHRGWQRH
jgi:hypothetical protein